MSVNIHSLRIVASLNINIGLETIELQLCQYFLCTPKHLKKDEMQLIM